MKAAIRMLCVMLPVFMVMGFLSISEDPKEVIRKAEEKMRGKTSEAEMTIQTVRPTWTREMKLKTWGKGTSYAVILVTAPVKEKGTVFLKKEKEVWNWVPSIERVIKLPPSMMTQSWMGTDFTNDDLVKESSAIEDYTHSFLKDSLIDGRICYSIKMIPKQDAAVVWGKIIVWIDKKDYLQLRAEFYDEENMLVSTMQSSDVRIMGGRMIPARVEMIPADKKGHKTVMIYNNIRFDEPIEDSFFTTPNMKKVK
ncbi:MAG: outer membrane lipoprotein-sorting protein [Bacteroidetes bacterium]|nr:MAG: outer membrane lipoprotein-sorting protein [Bacteroidota bacterium]